MCAGGSQKAFCCRAVERVSYGRYESCAPQGVPRLMKRLGVFASGTGSNLRSIYAATESGDIPARIVRVVTDNPDCQAASFARGEGVEALTYPASGATPDSLVEALRQARIDVLILAGYMKLVPREVLAAYPRAVLNIHPALLPAFGGRGYYGLRVHEAVIDSGAKFSGATVHFVDEQYDHGPIVAQAVVPVLAEDSPATLAARVLEQEHQLYPQVVAALCSDQVRWREDGVPNLEPSIILQATSIPVAS